ncbi:cytochrome c-type biogenesis protein [Shimia abyssi]|uniref:Cytochrome c-type biogenesis protein n=1 Tax=Shimia abyssi TaxID=1662395 RepID=A0A2P8FG18_9RHOB|nr:cytochrome c-type biogenesis protein [Shimia abyssi]PSL20654.1 cytochrome c-type biogenesis protein CcmH [Shimia abyssi]
MRLWQVLTRAAMVVLIALPVWAVQPDEVLDDPELEARARVISKDLRCLVCRNESIDESNADLARDLRILVRERLSDGDTNDEVIDFVVDRYGEYVLLRPQTGGSNLLLWAAGPMAFLLALVLAGAYLRRRSVAPEPVANSLSNEEQARLDEILKD